MTYKKEKKRKEKKRKKKTIVTWQSDLAILELRRTRIPHNDANDIEFGFSESSTYFYFETCGKWCLQLTHAFKLSWLKALPEMISLIGLKISSRSNYKWAKNNNYKQAGIIQSMRGRKSAESSPTLLQDMSLKVLYVRPRPHFSRCNA